MKIEKPILLIGGSGMLGRAWRELLAASGLTFDAPPHAGLDLLDRAAVRRCVTDRYGFVVNCSGWTDVDGAEKNLDAAKGLNGYAVGDWAERCVAVGAVPVHYSTDYVFQGAGTPIAPDESREPINAYGYSKEIGEELIERYPERFLLIRTSWLYAPWSKNFVRAIARLAKEKPMLRVVNDQRGRPTSAEHLAAASLALMEKNAHRVVTPAAANYDTVGTFHVTDGGECTWFDFASEIVKLIGTPCRVEPCATAEFPRPAKRPAYSVLDIGATERLLGPMPGWRDNLADVVRRLEL